MITPRYRFGLSQADQTLTIELPPTQQFPRLETLDAWLVRCLDIESAALPAHSTPKQTEPDALYAAQLAWRVLWVAADLLQSVPLPVLNPGRILALHRDTPQDRWTVTLAVPALPYLPGAVTERAYQCAMSVVFHLDTDNVNDEQVSALCEQIATQLLNPAKLTMPLTSSILHVLRAAQKQQLPWTHLGNGIFQIGWGRRSVRFHSSRLFTDSASGVETAQHKFWAAQWLRRIGLPAPEQAMVSSAEQASAQAEAWAYKLVVKPADKDRGEGITVLPATPQAVAQAYADAYATGSRQIMVERWVPGVCHRILVVKGHVVYVVKRLPIAVEGNGHDSIAQLIQAANQAQQKRPPWKRKTMLPCDETTDAVLAHYQLNRHSVLAKGNWAPLRHIESTQWGGIDLELTPRIHPDNADIAIRAAQEFGLDCAGVDMISTDLTRPWHENGAVINEVNSAPTLGGGPASLRTLPDMLQWLLPEGGRIPVEVYTGGQAAEDAARQRQHALAKEGVAACLVLPQRTEMPKGQHLPAGTQAWQDRCTALLTRQDTEHLLIVLESAAALQDGLPVDRVEAMVEVN